MDGGAWCAAAYGVAQSQTRLKRISSPSSSSSSSETVLGEVNSVTASFFFFNLTLPFSQSLSSPDSKSLATTFLLFLWVQLCVDQLIPYISDFTQYFPLSGSSHLA